MTFTNFLDKFKTLRLFYKSPDVIHRVTREAVEDAAKDNIRYLELRFTPVALSRAEGFPLHDVMDWVMTSAQDAAKKNKIKVGLIASVNRHESPDLAEQVAWLAAEHIKDGLVGMDLAGNEAEFKSDTVLWNIQGSQTGWLAFDHPRRRVGTCGECPRCDLRISTPSGSVMVCV